MEFVKLTLEEELAVVTLDRPKSLNALNSQVYREIIATLRQVEEMDEIKVVILTGAGQKAFAAGADIAQMVHEDAMGGRRLSALCHGRGQPAGKYAPGDHRCGQWLCAGRRLRADPGL